jgi:hypothetical protein
MIEAKQTSEIEISRWVHYHVIGFFLAIGVVLGLIIVDTRIEEIIGAKRMPGFRTILLLSVLLAGLGARALVAWRSATVDLQGRIFLTLTGLVLLTGAALGLSDCLQEIKEQYKAREIGIPMSRATAPWPSLADRWRTSADIRWPISRPPQISG